jgi:hypothetical protein
MIKFLAGAIAGGAVVWFWGDRMRQLAHDKSGEVRDKVARGLETVQSKAEGALETAKEQVKSGLQAGQDYIRSDERKSPTSSTTYR